VDKIITIKDGRTFEEKQPSELEVIAWLI
jgi:hypothetical protein